MYIHPYAYECVIPESFHEELKCDALETGYPTTEGPFSRVENLTSLGGKRFVSFAKYRLFHDGKSLHSIRIQVLKCQVKLMMNLNSFFIRAKEEHICFSLYNEILFAC